MGVPIVVGVPLKVTAPPAGASATEVATAQTSSTGYVAPSDSTSTSSSVSPFSSYITGVGDEPPADTQALNLSAVFNGSTMSQLTYFLQYLPRSMFTPWFDQNILPSITAPPATLAAGGLIPTQPLSLADTQNIVKNAFLSMFNGLNATTSSAQGLSPWAWETLKTEAYYNNISLPQESTLFQSITANVDPQAISIALQYQALTPLGDPGLELRRQNAVFWLLQNQYYTDAQNVITQFQNLSNVQTAIIAVPIPTQIPIPATLSSSGAAETLNPSNAS